MLLQLSRCMLVFSSAYCSSSGRMHSSPTLVKKNGLACTSSTAAAAAISAASSLAVSCDTNPAAATAVRVVSSVFTWRGTTQG